MAHKSKFRETFSTAAPLPERVRRALQNHSFHQALDLARQLYKQDPSEANLKTLREASFERGRQLQQQGQAKDAVTVYGNAAEMGGPPEFQRLLAENMAQCGAADKAMALVDRLNDPALKAHLHGQAADQAVRQGMAALVSADLRPQLDAILQAFALLEKGQDEQVRTCLQAISLQSPFMEWRVLIRGLMAYYAKDDARALENWQRLDVKRLPARLAAPLRFSIDQAFRAAQAPEAQNILRQQLDRWQGSGFTPGLRSAQSLLANPDTMAQAFRQAENLLEALRQQTPPLVSRLAACFRWAVIDHGEPEDVDRYKRAFEAPADDPHLERMEALAVERRGLVREAHLGWQKYEKTVAATAAQWPGEQARHVRALIWAHLGELAAAGELAEDDAPDFDDFDDYLDFPPFGSSKKKNKPVPFEPPAAECYRKSLELAPEACKTHEALFLYHVLHGQTAKARKAGANLLKRFPDHAGTLEGMGNLAMNESELDEAREYFQRAVQANPLESRLRFLLGMVHQERARVFSRGKHFDEARAECAAAMPMQPPGVSKFVLCSAAIIELKAKNLERYQELLAKIENEMPYRLTMVYALMCESIRQNLPPAQKKPFATEFQAALKGDIDPEVIPKLAAQALVQRGSGSLYVGQKSHEKKILALVDRAPFKTYPEDLLEPLCHVLVQLGANRSLSRCIQAGRQRFPSNPAFVIADARSLLGRSPSNRWRIEGCLKHARELIDELPRGERQEHFRAELADLEEIWRDQAGPGNMFSALMNRMFNGPFGDDEEDS